MRTSAPFLLTNNFNPAFATGIRSEFIVSESLNNIYVNVKELKNLNSKSNTILLNKPKNVFTTFSEKHKRKPFIYLQRVNLVNISLGYLKEADLKLTNND